MTNTHSEDLVAELRDFENIPFEGDASLDPLIEVMNNLSGAAADRIEELERGMSEAATSFAAMSMALETTKTELATANQEADTLARAFLSTGKDIDWTELKDAITIATRRINGETT